MKIKNLAIFILLNLSILTPKKCDASNNTEIIFNNTKIPTENTYIINNRTYISLEDISKIFDLHINKIPNKKYIVLSKNDINIFLNDSTVYCDGIHFGNLKGEEVIKIFNNTIYIPIRYISNALHKDISYNPNNNTINISDINADIIYPLLLTNEIDSNLIESEIPIYYYNNHYIFYSDSLTKSLDLKSFTSLLDLEYKNHSYFFNNNIFIMHPERAYIVGGIQK